MVLKAVDGSLFDSEEQRGKLKKLRSQIFGKDPLEQVDMDKNYFKQDSLKEFLEDPEMIFKVESSENEKDQI